LVTYEGCDATLIRLATLLVGRHDASDVVQEAVFRTVTSTRYEAVTNHQAYLVRALINMSRQKHRSDRRRVAREAKRALDANATTELDDGRGVDVRLAVSRLSYRQRSVMYLLYWEDRSVVDVANILDISPGAVSRHAARARTKLRGVLGD
jgi:RNA polymerase sigma factor (sigma-70 family)